MYPGTHSQFGDEYVAALGEENGCLGRDHFHFRVGLHHLLDSSKRQLVQLELMSVALEMADGLLPIGGQDILVLAGQALMDLKRIVIVSRWSSMMGLMVPELPGGVRTLAHGPVYSSAGA